MTHHPPIRVQVITLILVFTILLGGLVFTSAQAQGGGAKPIKIGDTVKGNINDTNYQEMYTLTLSSGDSVTITEASSDGLDAYLILQDAKSTVLLKDDDSAGSHNAQIKFTAKTAGDYTIIATRYGQQTGKSVGSYTLTVAG